ncbi:MAG: TraR/DksA family transcriptional regulator [Actinomycetota bacterium]|nr:TraR/DksA family transcriptional regulator [Actinomycetota bacterium]MDH5313893.1 TraR/DksA family transcriptional regulator [Actinomycetota bacterium]
MDDETTPSRRAALEAQRVHLREEIVAQGADPDSDEVTFVDDRGFADRSHSTEERSRLISVSRALRSNLRDVERALAKMDAGTYGRCERCGGPVGEERLDALPWAMLCIDCKNEGVDA